MLAIEILCRMKLQRINERLAMGRSIKQLNVHNLDAIRLAHKLVCETTRRQNFIDRFINDVLKPEAVSAFNLRIQAFLRLYVYQTRIIRNWTRVDFEEAEKIVRATRSILGWKHVKKVERVLGTLLTKNPALMLENVNAEERLGLLTFHPTWFVKYCFKLLGRRETLAMFEANMRKLPLYIRLNTVNADEDDILETLANDGITVKEVEKLKQTFEVVCTRKPLTRTESFHLGHFFIQDKASCFAAEAANPKPEITLLDVCAAPGAKTTHLAQLMQNRGTIYSIDYSRRRMTIWKNQVARMNTKIAFPIIGDACNPLPLKIRADLAILDPPCTSTGAFSKLTSSKWRLTRRSIDKMAEIQWQMINSCSENLQPSGTLIYSTCSITVEENEMIINRFLKWHTDFSLAEITPKIGLPGLRGLQKCRRLYPHIHRCNGFFIAKLVKQA